MIRIWMHSTRYETVKVLMKQLPMRCDMIQPCYDVVRSDLDSIQHNVIRCNMMQWGKKDHF